MLHLVMIWIGLAALLTVAPSALAAEACSLRAATIGQTSSTFDIVTAGGQILMRDAEMRATLREFENLSSAGICSAPTDTWDCFVQYAPLQQGFQILAVYQSQQIPLSLSVNERMAQATSDLYGRVDALRRAGVCQFRQQALACELAADPRLAGGFQLREGGVVLFQPLARERYEPALVDALDALDALVYSGYCARLPLMAACEITAGQGSRAPFDLTWGDRFIGSADSRFKLVEWRQGLERRGVCKSAGSAVCSIEQLRAGDDASHVVMIGDEPLSSEEGLVADIFGQYKHALSSRMCTGRLTSAPCDIAAIGSSATPDFVLKRRDVNLTNVGGILEVVHFTENVLKAGYCSASWTRAACAIAPTTEQNSDGQILYALNRAGVELVKAPFRECDGCQESVQQIRNHLVDIGYCSR